MNVELLFPSKYVKAADLPATGAVVTIEKFVAEDLQMVGGKKQRKGVMYFKGKEKSFVLGAKVNKQVLVHLYGSETDNWAGKKVVIYPTRDTFMGKMVDCIRLRSEKQEAMEDFTCGNANYMRDYEDWMKGSAQ